jgi:hypothetical protein
VSKLSFAQDSVFMSMGVIGSFSSGVRACSSSFQFNGKNECFQVESGIVVLSGIRSNGDFEVVCRSSSSIFPLDIQLFPNPVHQYARIEGGGFSDPTEQVLLTLFDAVGKRIWEKRIYAAEVKSGISYFWGWLQAGNYFLSVKGGNKHKVIPFLKLN